MTRTLATDGAWCWFQDPRAVRHVGDRDRTYTGWLSRGGDVVAASVDHDTGAVERTVLHADFEADDHDAPAVRVDADGHVTAFYTAHGGPDVRYRRSVRPESVAEMGPERAVAPSAGHTYPNPRVVDGTLYLFYRNDEGSLAYVTSPDGERWSPERELVTTDGREWCVYFKLSRVHDGGVDAALTYAAGGRSEPHRDLRHVRFDGDAVRAADGTGVGDPPVAFWDAPAVYDSDETGHDAWVWDCSVAGGAPEAVYAELAAEDDHRYRYARWTGDGWDDRHLADAGSHVADRLEFYYSGGVVLDHDDPGVCYASVGDRESSELHRYERDGDGWDRTVLATGEQNVRPVVPWNRHDDLPVLWMRGEYRHYADGEYETEIVGPGP